MASPQPRIPTPKRRSPIFAGAQATASVRPVYKPTMAAVNRPVGTTRPVTFNPYNPAGANPNAPAMAVTYAPLTKVQQNKKVGLVKPGRQREQPQSPEEVFGTADFPQEALPKPTMLPDTWLNSLPRTSAAIQAQIEAGVYPSTISAADKFLLGIDDASLIAAGYKKQGHGGWARQDVKQQKPTTKQASGGGSGGYGGRGGRGGGGYGDDYGGSYYPRASYGYSDYAPSWQTGRRVYADPQYNPRFETLPALNWRI